MVYALLLAHLFGDYVFQSDAVARWKARSVVGVLVHGGIVTVTTLLCTIWFGPQAWPISLVVGSIHTCIDLTRRALSLKGHSPHKELWLFLGDQALHLATIGLIVWLLEGTSTFTTVLMPGELLNPRWLVIAVGYCFLTKPAWITVRFAVRGLWGSRAAPPLEEGDKYGAMVERLMIATLVIIKQPLWVPVVVAIRPIASQLDQSEQRITLMQYPANWVETMLSILLAIVTGAYLQTKV